MCGSQLRLVLSYTWTRCDNCTSQESRSWRSLIFNWKWEIQGTDLPYFLPAGWWWTNLCREKQNKWIFAVMNQSGIIFFFILFFSNIEVGKIYSAKFYGFTNKGIAFFLFLIPPFPGRERVMAGPPLLSMYIKCEAGKKKEVTLAIG